ncbi:MAG: TlpA family protein disulfide reductase [Halobacteriales archaeon]
MTTRDLDRRAFLSAAAAVAVTGTAGCSGDGGDPTTETDVPDDGTDAMTGTSNDMAGAGTETTDGTTGTEMTDGTTGTEMTDGMNGTATTEKTTGTEMTGGMGEDSTATGGGMEGTATPAGDLAPWRTVELTDVLTDETFTIASLDGPVVIQSFAVWCPKCERQSKKMKGLDDSVTVVSLNTDPNEDAEKVKQHAESNGFDWRFAVSPTEMTDALIEAFGSGVTVAPSTPIIVACEGGDAEFMSGSILSAQEIQSTASDC